MSPRRAAGERERLARDYAAARRSHRPSRALRTGLVAITALLRAELGARRIAPARAARTAPGGPTLFD
jgi:hypothetical protein